MMLHPDGVALFTEVPKTGSTACTIHLRKAGWFQNGSQGTQLLPGTFPGRHAQITDELAAQLVQLGVTTYGVVRNPYDRMASLWRASAPKSQSFIDYMRTGRFKHGPIDIMREPQHKWLQHVDVVLRYERLQADWEDAILHHGHLPPGEIPRVNVSKKRAKPDWTSEERALVEERFADDLDRYGYEEPS